MNRRSQWLFEAPISLQATDYNPYTSLELEDAGERQREVVKPLPNTPVGRELAKMGVKHLIIEKPPLLHPAHWVRGLIGFEVHCARHRQINVVFGLFDQQKKSLAWHLFSSTVDSSSKLACKRSGSTPVVKEPFGVASGVATFTPRLQKSQIDISELVRDTKSPFATMTLDTKTDKNRITCRLDNLNTKSNGLVHLAFGLRKVSEPSRANVAIPGKLFFLSVEPFDEEKFRNDRFLDEFQRQTRITVQVVPNGTVQRLRKQKGNLASLRSRPGFLQVEQQVFQNTARLLKEIRHELAFYYAGGPGKTPHLKNTPFNSLDLLEMMIQSDGRLPPPVA